MAEKHAPEDAAVCMVAESAADNEQWAAAMPVGEARAVARLEDDPGDREAALVAGKSARSALVSGRREAPLALVGGTTAYRPCSYRTVGVRDP